MAQTKAPKAPADLKAAWLKFNQTVARVRGRSHEILTETENLKRQKTLEQIKTKISQQ